MKEMVLKRMALQSKDKKGFTLVEVIVVLVILAILMAIAIPALTGYIEKARMNAVTTEARSAQVALQTIGTEIASDGGDFTAITATGATTLATSPFDLYAPISTVASPTILDEIKALSSAKLNGVTLADITYEANGQLSTFTFANGTYEVDYDVDSGYGDPEKVTP
jgi:type IV pilus assembly protein PilA